MFINRDATKYIVKGNIAIICAGDNHTYYLAKLLTAIYEIKDVASQRINTVMRYQHSKRFSLALTLRRYNTIAVRIFLCTFS